MTDDQLKAMFDALRQESNLAHVETRRQFAETTDRHIAESRHFFRIEADGLRHEIQLVADGATSTSEKLDREAADIREEVRRTATETQVMIKFSHA